jgi:hypothetical protein
MNENSPADAPPISLHSTYVITELPSKRSPRPSRLILTLQTLALSHQIGVVTRGTVASFWHFAAALLQLQRAHLSRFLAIVAGGFCDQRRTTGRSSQSQRRTTCRDESRGTSCERFPCDREHAFLITDQYPEV